MTSLGTNEASIVQAILPYLSEEGMAEPTARALGAMAIAPDICVPALRKATDSRSPEVRVWAVVALGRFGHDASSATPELARALVDSDARVRREAMDALEKIAPDTGGVTNGTKGLRRAILLYDLASCVFINLYRTIHPVLSLVHSATRSALSFDVQAGTLLHCQKNSRKILH